MPQVLEEGKSRTTREGSDVAILAFGRMVQEAEGAADILAKEGVSVRVVDMRWIKPFDEEAVRKAALECKLVCTAEEGAIEGGIGEGILEALAANPPAQVPPCSRLAFLTNSLSRARCLSCTICSASIRAAWLLAFARNTRSCRRGEENCAAGCAAT